MAEPITLAAILGSQVLGSAIGNAMGRGDRKRARELQEEAYQQVSGVAVPGIEGQRITLQKLVEGGQLTPEALETILQEDSEMKGISVDPRLKTAQMQALDRLSKQGLEGLNLSDRVALDEVRNQVEGDTQARNKAVLQDMAQRGMGGAGAELAMQMQASQSGANRAKLDADRLAAMAQQRALEATMNAGRLGGEIRSQDFGEQERIASAQDAINRFNAANRQDVTRYNVQGRNDAQADALQRRRMVSDANADLANKKEIHNKGLIGQDYDRRLNKATAAANAATGQASNLLQTAGQTQSAFAGAGQGIAQGITALEYMNSKDKKAGHYKGGEIRGEAKFEGDHPDNDTVPTMLSPGEVVIPRSVIDESDKIILDFIKKARKG
jgi:hypothetical protein